MKDAEIEHVFVIGGMMVQVNYEGGIHYRTVRGTDDISGDRNQYDTIKALEAGNFEVTAKGDENRIFLATFNDGEYCYSISFKNGIATDELTGIIESID